MKTQLRLIVAAFVLVAFSLSTATVQAQFNYTTNNGTITITGYTGPGGAVTIPDTINGLPVTSIGVWAFRECTGLTSVTIPNSVTNIGDMAFVYCLSLTAIAVDPQNPAYSSVDGVLFDKARTKLIRFPAKNTLRSYTVPESVTNICSWAFLVCTGLTSVAIPSSLTEISSVPPFYDCANLTTITVDNENPAYSSVDGVLFNKSRTTLIQCPAVKSGGYTIPNSVTVIEYAAFRGCTSITNVMMGRSVTNIEEEAFSDCTRLASITIPDSIITIKEETFSGAPT